MIESRAEVLDVVDEANDATRSCTLTLIRLPQGARRGKARRPPEPQSLGSVGRFDVVPEAKAKTAQKTCPESLPYLIHRKLSHVDGLTYIVNSPGEKRCFGIAGPVTWRNAL